MGKHRKRKSERQDAPPPPDRAVRPTAERLKLNQWALPQGAGKSEQPFVDLTPDIVAQFHAARLITASQEQAARQFEAARTSYLKEFPEITQFKSCLAGDVPGYDDGDGDKAVKDRYLALEALAGRQGTAVLVRAIHDGQAPRGWGQIKVFRDALQRISDGRRM